MNNFPKDMWYFCSWWLWHYCCCFPSKAARHALNSPWILFTAVECYISRLHTVAYIYNRCVYVKLETNKHSTDIAADFAWKYIFRTSSQSQTKHIYHNTTQSTKTTPSPHPRRFSMHYDILLLGLRIWCKIERTNMIRKMTRIVRLIRNIYF